MPRLELPWSRPCRFQSPDAEISAVRFSLCVVAERYILQQKCLKKRTSIALLGTRRYNFQLPVPAPSAKYTALGLQTDRQTDGQRKVHAKSRSYCVLYDRLITTDKSHLEHAVNLYKFKITVKQRLGLGNKFGKVACAGSYRNAQRF